MACKANFVGLLCESANGELAATTIAAELQAVGVDWANERFVLTLAAAIEYFSTREPLTAATFRKAALTVEGGDYLFYEDASNYEDVGYAFFNEKCRKNALMYLPDWLEDYINFESLGEEVAERGEFTRYGFFSPDERGF